MSCKSLIYTVLTDDTPVVANGAVPVGNIVRRFGCGIRLDGNSFTLTEPGYYRITVDATIQPVAATPISLYIYENGVQLAGGVSTVTPTGAGANTLLTIPAAVSRVYCDGNKTIAIGLSAAATVDDMTVTIEKV